MHIFDDRKIAYVTDRNKLVSTIYTDCIYIKRWLRQPSVIIIIIIMLVYYSCSQNATTEPTSVTQDSTDTIERKASI